MFKVFLVVFLIFGTVVGSGFSSGKEIMVFFSRFGGMSYVYISLAGVLFFALFYFFLSRGKKISATFEKYKFLNLIVVFISLIFCSSMFAGIKNLFSYFPNWAEHLAILLLILMTIFVTLHGISGLEKANFLLMPLTSVLFFVVLLFEIFSSSKNMMLGTSAWAGALYCPLYVALNTCMSGLIICKSGEALSKRQKLLASALATGLLLCFLFLGNFVLQKNGEFVISEMPFLAIAAKNPWTFAISYFVILVGCFTTLISLCFTLKSSFDRILKDKVFSAVLAVMIPFAISSLGFSQIVSLLYPICSVLGILILILMIFGQAKREKQKDLKKS